MAHDPALRAGDAQRQPDLPVLRDLAHLGSAPGEAGIARRGSRGSVTIPGSAHETPYGSPPRDGAPLPRVRQESQYEEF